MSERRERVISEIKEVVKRLDGVFSDYQIDYYKVMPDDSRKCLCESLEKVIAETEILVFYSGIGSELDPNKAKEANTKYNVDNIFNYLESAVNEVLKCYNESVARNVSDIIELSKNKLLKIGCNVEKEFGYLSKKIDISTCVEIYEEKYPELVELQEIISIINGIEFLQPGNFTNEIHEFYGLKALLLELLEKIEIIEIIEDTACRNIVIDFINSTLKWDLFEDIT